MYVLSLFCSLFLLYSGSADRIPRTYSVRPFTNSSDQIEEGSTLPYRARLHGQLSTTPPPANHSIHQQRWAALFLFFSLNLEYGAAQMVVRWLAVRHARVPISARHPCSYEDMEKGHRVQSVIIQKKKKRLLGLPASHHNPRSLDQGQF
jgi:hypothetical protein